MQWSCKHVVKLPCSSHSAKQLLAHPPPCPLVGICVFDLLESLLFSECKYTPGFHLRTIPAPPPYPQSLCT